MIKAIIFDLGGVLIEDPKYKEFWAGIDDTENLRGKFGVGKLTTDEFASIASELFNLSKEGFLDSYNKAYCSFNLIKDVFEIYNSIKVDKYILSDTNPIHGDYIQKEFPEIFNQAKGVYFSHKVKMRKDDTKIFDYVINDIGLAPEEVVFIDNKERIINLAKDTGINGIVFENAEQLEKELNELLEVKNA